MNNHNKFIFTSRGLETVFGAEIISQAICKIIKDNDIANKKILIVLPSFYYSDDRVINNCSDICNFSRENIFLTSNYENEDAKIDLPKDLNYIYVTGGNTFAIAKYMQDYGMDEFIKKQMQKESAPVYIGASAGSMLAANDYSVAKNFDDYKGYERDEYIGLGLLKTCIIPHYTFSECKKFVDNLVKSEPQRYGHREFINVANDEALVISKEGECITKKRIRIRS